MVGTEGELKWWVPNQCQSIPG